MNLLAYQIPVEDQKAFAKFMCFIARADGVIADEEKQVIDSIVQTWKLDSTSVREVYDVLEGSTTYGIEQLARELNDPKTGYLLIQELITLAHIDGDYAQVEREAIKMIACRLQINESRVEALENWVQEGVAWRNKGIALVTPEGVV